MIYFGLKTFLFLSYLLFLGYLLYRLKEITSFKTIKNKVILHVFLIIIVAISLFFMFFDTMNALVVVIHLFVFLKIYDLIYYLVKKVSKRQFNNICPFLLTIITGIIYFSYGYYLAHHVVETDYIIQSKKNIGVDNFRVVQISDSHIGATMNGHEFAKYMEEINALEPDLVVITGDYVDDGTKFKDMISATQGLGKLNAKYGVYFIFGNHDKAYFKYRNFDEERLRQELESNDVIILEDEVVEITDDIYLLGRQDSQEKKRKEAEELTNKLDKNKYIICLDHKPDDYGNEVNAGCDLVLNGHTHGGQIWPLGPISVFLGINDAYYGKQEIDDTTFIVNAGIGDWTVKFKIGTIAEYVVIDIKNK